MGFFGKGPKKDEDQTPSWFHGGGRTAADDRQGAADDADVRVDESAALVGEGDSDDDEHLGEHVGATVDYGTRASSDHSHHSGVGHGGGGDDDRTDISWSVEGGSVQAATTASTETGGAAGGRKKSAKTYIRRAREKLRRRRERSLAGMPHRSCCHMIFVLLNVATLLSCLCMALSQVMPLIFVPLPLLQAVLRGYLTFFCVVFAVAELELPLPFIRSSQTLHDFKSKGFLFTFLSCVAMEQGVAAGTKVTEDLDELLARFGQEEMGTVAAVFIEVSSWLMLGVGVLYMVLGLLCMKRVRDRCREDYAQRMEEWFESRRSQIKPDGVFV